MRRALSRALPSLVLLAAVAACGSTPAAQSPQTSNQPATSRSAPSSAAAPTGPPPAPQPTSDAPCTYLDNRFVADANGQLVNHVRTSEDKPYPTCFFYGNPKDIQLTVRVYVGDPKIATAIVDQAAPRASSDPADDIAGWTGGKMPTADGAVYAVAKGGTAVVVNSDQKQTVKPRRVVETVIKNLKL
ncbi:DUF2020 domain-containing protein [Solihabitans fulvus]|uniref:DUF2020 domain-containing protein n=1 Tax=Solihabitans fulvus TaxID=1892852 RepID=A0A5B2XKC4_9PSEU|nr:DUF2020 domain-containing protein [Solihabitans fulvus]KAA2263746.1 DUF2020 domain-containing protein [Solihabitans fulvus]